MCRTSNLSIADLAVQTPSWANRCFCEQETLHSLLSTVAETTTSTPPTTTTTTSQPTTTTTAPQPPPPPTTTTAPQPTTTTTAPQPTTTTTAPQPPTTTTAAASGGSDGCVPGEFCTAEQFSTLTQLCVRDIGCQNFCKCNQLMENSVIVYRWVEFECMSGLLFKESLGLCDWA
ncbi:integumentary mucin C.1-like [Ruditapes philippinarum]|uniref:integumentary mucin C.1-like n=1 Tax=Ruditapes philippinarum TaxID=129788 RepID=UPI00295AAE55|nr:integumentary mucin C.1-like [Ruditapes philippinarum]